jgi:hypothetical protein
MFLAVPEAVETSWILASKFCTAVEAVLVFAAT